MVITITAEDNQRALEARDAADERYKWDVCRTCPVAQAFDRVFPNLDWLVNRNGARPNGARSYWYTLSKSLIKALDTFDQSIIDGGLIVPILGTFEIFNHSDKCKGEPERSPSATKSYGTKV